MGGFREHIAIDGSLNGVSGRDAACGLAVGDVGRTGSGKHNQNCGHSPCHWQA